MNATEQEGLDRVSKGQLGIVVTLLTTLATAIYGYGSVTTQLAQSLEIVKELRMDVKALQEARYTSMEAVRQVSEIREAVGRLDSRITYVEREGLAILRKDNAATEGIKSQR